MSEPHRHPLATPVPLPRLMGIVNVTPDSFSDGGQFLGTEAAIAHGVRLAAEGASILDIGGESTRPGAETVPADVEAARVVPVIVGLRARLPAITLSVDTRKPGVAEAAVAAGASMWNDVSALTYDPASPSLAAALGVAVVLMHAQGTPETMQQAPHYTDVLAEVTTFLQARRAVALAAGVAPTHIVLDPGIGFGKTLTHNLTLLAGLEQCVGLGAPVLLGASRKRFVGALDAEAPATDRLAGSLAAALRGAEAGVAILRVHDVAATRQALAVWGAICTQRNGFNSLPRHDSCTPDRADPASPAEGPLGR